MRNPMLLCILLVYSFLHSPFGVAQEREGVPASPLVENVSFYTEDSILLQGVLCLPCYTFPEKIVIYIPPLYEYDSVIVPMVKKWDTSHFIGKLFWNLLSANIGVFAFSMRSPCPATDASEMREIIKTYLS